MKHRRELFLWRERQKTVQRIQEKKPRIEKAEPLPDSIVREMEIVCVPHPDKRGKVDFDRAQKQIIEIRTNIELPESSLNSLQNEKTLFAGRRALDKWTLEKYYR